MTSSILALRYILSALILEPQIEISLTGHKRKASIKKTSFRGDYELSKNSRNMYILNIKITNQKNERIEKILRGDGKSLMLSIFSSHASFKFYMEPSVHSTYDHENAIEFFAKDFFSPSVREFSLLISESPGTIELHPEFVLILHPNSKLTSMRISPEFLMDGRKLNELKLNWKLT
ncbi:MAG: hypothetical protein ACYCR7_05815 [Thermoplasmataceae archaeon]